MLFLFATLIVIVAFILYQITHRPLPLFFAKQPNGQTMSLTSFPEPNLQADTILQWATKAATIAYTFDFVNYKKQTVAAKPYFTDKGWRDYSNSINNLVKTIIQNQLFVNGVVTGPPVISNQGQLTAGYSWRVQIPFLVTYQSANNTSTQNFYVILTIVKVPTNINPYGIGIDQFIMV